MKLKRDQLEILFSVYFKGTQVQISNYDVFISLKIVFTLTNSADPDEMPHFRTFHLGLHCLSMFTLRSLQYTKG